VSSPRHQYEQKQKSIQHVFREARVFKKDISNWVVSKVTDHDQFKDSCPLEDRYNPLKKVKPTAATNITKTTATLTWEEKSKN